jgi:essential nuclear protein 1
MLAKRYALPTQVIAALVRFFLKYEEQTEEEFEKMPVMWHQTLYTLCSSYRPYLTADEVFKIKNLIKKQFHHLITPEIRKALASTS